MATGKVVYQTPAYFGPNSSTYASDHSYAGPNDTVTVLWQEGSWYFIDYPTSTKRKQMYVPTWAVSSISGTIPTFTPIYLTRYVHVGGYTYAGTSTSYATAGSVSAGEMVHYLNTKTESFAFIEYTVTITGKKKRAYYYDYNLGEAPPATILIVGQRPSNLNINGDAYRSTVNMYYPTYVGQCTWFCWGRAYEKTRKRLSFTGSNNGGEWYKNINDTLSGVTKREASFGPVSNSICSCSGSTPSGHAIFVEQVVGNDVYYTEANVGGTDGIVKKASKSSFPVNRTAYGYIVL